MFDNDGQFMFIFDSFKNNVFINLRTRHRKGSFIIVDIGLTTLKIRTCHNNTLPKMIVNPQFLLMWKLRTSEASKFYV